MKRRLLKGSLVLGAIVVVTICDAAGLLTRGPAQWQPDPARPDQPEPTLRDADPSSALPAGDEPGAIEKNPETNHSEPTATQRSPR